MSGPSATWPAPPSAERSWRQQRLRSNDFSGMTETVTVREVQLWGRLVLINEADEVYCSDCWRFVPVDELGSVINGHPGGLPYRAGGWTWPMDLESDPVEAHRPEGL